MQYASQVWQQDVALGNRTPGGASGAVAAASNAVSIIADSPFYKVLA